MTPHPYINPTPLRVHLSGQLARLVRVIEGSDHACRVSEATRHASKLRRWIECETDIALTLKPVPQVDLQVEDICRHIERAEAVVRFTERAPCGFYRDAEAA